MTRETALEELRLLLMAPLKDIEEMFKCAEQKDWKKLRRVVKHIKERKAKQGI